jgi:aspartate kinase
MSFAIAKFGGTSMADASVARISASVLKSRPQIRVCVISATAGTTNQLMQMARDAAGMNPGAIPNALGHFRERHLDMLRHLKGSAETTKRIEEMCARVKEILQGMQLLREASLSAIDDLVSHGELISSLLFAEAVQAQGLKVHWIDARQVMKTSSDFGRALPHLSLLKEAAEKSMLPLVKDSIIVTQGYIGSDLNGRTTTLGKEGSDYSTALFAEALGAGEIQIWKDVPGVMTSDPRLVEDARTLSEISYAEASELTRFGAKVVHPDTFLPAQRAGIPVLVGYSQDPTVPGTRVVANPTETPAVRAVTWKSGQIWLTVKERAGHNSPLFLLNVLQVLNQYKVSPTLVSTAENNLGFVIDRLYSVSTDLMRELEELGVVSQTEAELVAIIGMGFHARTDLQARALSHMSDVAPFLVSTGASENSYCLLLPKGQSMELLPKLHAELLETT